MRHLAIGGGTLRELNQLRAPMAQIFSVFAEERDELARYRQKFGPLTEEGDSDGHNDSDNGNAITELGQKTLPSSNS